MWMASQNLIGHLGLGFLILISIVCTITALLRIRQMHARIIGTVAVGRETEQNEVNLTMMS